jgi:hypothetical protein
MVEHKLVPGVSLAALLIDPGPGKWYYSQILDRMPRAVASASATEFVSSAISCAFKSVK